MLFFAFTILWKIIKNFNFIDRYHYVSIITLRASLFIYKTYNGEEKFGTVSLSIIVKLIKWISTSNRIDI